MATNNATPNIKKETVNPAKRPPSTNNNISQPKHPKIARNALKPTGTLGKKHEVDYYVADETTDNRYRSKVIYLSFKQIYQSKVEGYVRNTPVDNRNGGES